jgi:outer membrane protein
VLLVSARRDAYVAGFQLLNAMGQAEAEDLGLEGGPLYDPLGNYRRVAGNWNDWSGDRRHEPVATRTVTPEEQSGRAPAGKPVSMNRPVAPLPVVSSPTVTPAPERVQAMASSPANTQSVTPATRKR